MKSKDILTVKNLSVRFGDENILKDLTFNVKEGEVFVILGPNGAGKTTLLRALLGLIPYTGEVTWQTKKISYLPPKEFLNKGELPPLSIKEFFSLKEVEEVDVADALVTVGLDRSLLSRQFTELSTGQFQRMLIAWALVGDPKVLLFDEPTSGIDVGGEETIYSLLHKFWLKRKLTILLVTHDLSVVWEHANNVLCLNKKELCMGPPENILTTEMLKKMYGTGIKFYRHHHESD